MRNSSSLVGHPIDMNYIGAPPYHSRHQGPTIPGPTTYDHHGSASAPSASENHPSTSISKKINDSVYELHVPSATQPDLDILFFHGLHLQQNSECEDHIDTWRSKCADQTLWPKEWLPEEFPNARVLTISYDGSVSKTDKQGRMDIFLVAESLLTSLLLAKVGQVRPVILIGHSYGGLVIKQICVLAHNKVSMQSVGFMAETEQLQALLDNIGGIFYYSTPHHGSRLMDVIGSWDNNEGELVKHVRVFSKDLARLNQEFQKVSDKFPWHISGVGETMPTDLGGRNCIIIVEEASARWRKFFAVEENHISICKPEGIESTTYQALVDFIRGVHHNCKPTEEFSSSAHLPGDHQMLPKTQVGVLASLAGGEILEKVKTVPVLGLWGMGGIGKTSLSKAIFNHLHSEFEYTLFVENVKMIPEVGEAFEETLVNQIYHWGRKMEKSVQETVPVEVHRRGRKMENLSNTLTLSSLTGKVVLMVLDDIDKDRDIEIVRRLRDQVSCSPNSRIILTSRNQHILQQVDDIEIVQVEELDPASSKALLTSYAFSGRDIVLPEWQQNCLERIVERCGGLPLVLEVIGKYLRGSDSKAVWEETCNSLAKVEGGETMGMNQVWSKLKISYDNLQDEQKQMFLDASTFFQDRVNCGWIRKQWTLGEAKAIWRVKYENGAQHWRTLVDRALVYEVGEDLPIKIHEHLRTLGQDLVQGIERIRSEEVQKFSTDLQLCARERLDERIQTLQLFSSDFKPYYSFNWVRFILKMDEDPRISIPNLHRMEMLQYLQLEGCRLVGWNVILPRNLLMFVGRISGENLSFLHSRNLVILYIHLYETKRLPRAFCSLEKLHSLHLKAEYLQCLPESFGWLRSLERCTLEYTRLEKLPESFGDLGNLRELTLNSKRLKRLPESFGRLRSLERCTLKCTLLEKLPESFGDLGNLRELTVEVWPKFSRSFVLEPRSLEKLPESFGHLGNLRKLTRECMTLKRLPESFGCLTSLQRCTLDCKPLEKLPESFGDLGNLRELTLKSMRLKTLPASFDRLKNLQQLSIYVPYLESLPTNFGLLECIQDIDIYSASLSHFPDSFLNLKNLRKLKLGGCKLPTQPGGFGELASLEILDLLDSSGRRHLPASFCFPSHLKILRVSFDSESEFESRSEWSHLQELSLMGSMKSMPDVSLRCGSLQKLEFFCCDNIECLPEGLGDLKNLEELTIKSCLQLQSLPETLGELKALKKLSIWGCDKFERLPKSLIALESLSYLDLWFLHCLRNIPDLHMMSSLKSLVLHDVGISRLPQVSSKCKVIFWSKKKY